MRGASFVALLVGGRRGRVLEGGEFGVIAMGNNGIAFDEQGRHPEVGAAHLAVGRTVARGRGGRGSRREGRGVGGEFFDAATDVL